jgi:hypothetical protein
MCILGTFVTQCFDTILIFEDGGPNMVGLKCLVKAVKVSRNPFMRQGSSPTHSYNEVRQFGRFRKDRYY